LREANLGQAHQYSVLTPRATDAARVGEQVQLVCFGLREIGSGTQRQHAVQQRASIDDGDRVVDFEPDRQAFLEPLPSQRRVAAANDRHRSGRGQHSRPSTRPSLSTGQSQALFEPALALPPAAPLNP
jgi:hypothetical protein